MKSYFKIVRCHPETGSPWSIPTRARSSTSWARRRLIPPGMVSASIQPQLRAMAHGVPGDSKGRAWPAVLLCVTVDNEDILDLGRSSRKTLVRRLRVKSIEQENIHPDIVQQNFSPHRINDAAAWLEQGWAGFREVGWITRGSPAPDKIPSEARDRYVIECRPASSGRYARSVVYRAVPASK
jgi:hypothetical protein